MRLRISRVGPLFVRGVAGVRPGLEFGSRFGRCLGWGCQEQANLNTNPHEERSN
jgi:hypothetical protein